MAEPTHTTAKRPAARRVFAEKAVWLRCSLVEDPQGIFSLVASRHPAFSAKTGPFRIFRQALMRVWEGTVKNMSARNKTRLLESLAGSKVGRIAPRRRDTSHFVTGPLQFLNQIGTQAASPV